MSKKDRNKSTVVILRDFNCELLDKLKDFTNEKTGAKAIKFVCARYLNLEKVTDEQSRQIEDLDNRLSCIANALKSRLYIEREIREFLETK